MNTSGGQNLRLGAIQQILGQVGKTASAGLSSFTGGSGWGGTSSNGGFTAASGEGSGASFYLSVLFNFLMYVLILFIVLLVIHFTYRPIFSFLPSDKGFLPIPGFGDNRVYWNSKTQPPPEDPAPKNGVKDPLLTYAFKDNFSLSVDVLIKQLPSSNQKNRVILYKAPYYGEDVLSGVQAGTLTSGGVQTKTITTTASPFTQDPGTDLVQYFTGKASMIMYLNETNDLIVLFYSTAANKPFASRPIKNIPLNTPFRIGVVVENKFFSVYLNGKFVFQRFVPDGFSLMGGNSRFYTPPTWGTTTKSVYVQNLILWQRAINSVEVREASPALALRPDFDAGEDPDSGICAA
jgi:hypothetical protein